MLEKKKREKQQGAIGVFQEQPMAMCLLMLFKMTTYINRFMISPY
jgi:hypothetical protein